MVGSRVTDSPETVKPWYTPSVTIRAVVCRMGPVTAWLHLSCVMRSLRGDHEIPKHHAYTFDTRSLRPGSV
jgi:hypothetical protein